MTQKKWKIYIHEVGGQTETTAHIATTKMTQSVLPVLQLLVTKRVVDIHDISSEEHDDPQSNEHRTFLLKYYSLRLTINEYNSVQYLFQLEQTHLLNKLKYSQSDS